MQLTTYLKDKNLSPSKFAKQNGLRQPTVWRILNYKFRPSPDIALHIEQATGGAVTLRELLFPDQRKE